LLAAPAWAMNKLSTLFLRLVFKETSERTETAFTRLDLEDFVNDPRTSSKEDIDKEMFGKALNLKDIRVREAMVPRPEIEYIDIKTSIEELERLFKETKHSRIIVVKDDIDNVLGYVHHQQLLKKPKTIRGLVMGLPFVPEVMSVTKLMNRFIKERENIACVVDEYGGVAGVITLEDIVEEIFGDIEDEHDQEEYVEVQISNKEYIFSGRLEIDYLNEKYPNLRLPEGDYHTLSGYLVMTTETIPERGARIELNGYRFILEMVSETKIETIRVIKLDEEANGK
jgi:CBS domain containing-hemolysin-like protein